jgi:phosphoglycerate dehydrogenase-like enzyme
VARGEVIVEDALFAALRADPLDSVDADVFVTEPLPPAAPATPMSV